MYNQYKKRVLLAWVLLAALPMSAQVSSPWMLGLGYHGGKTIKHSRSFSFSLPNYTQILTLRFARQTTGNRQWHSQHQFPRLGVEVLYADFETNTLGKAIGLLPQITLFLNRQPTFDWTFTLGTGMSYMTKPYHFRENPNNNAIGGRWNNVVVFRSDVLFHLTEQSNVTGGLSFFHFSNGRSDIPNLGLNSFFANIGFEYFLKTPPALEKLIGRSPSKPRWGAQIYTGYGFNELLASGGPKYPVYMAGAAVQLNSSPINRFLLGLEWEYRGELYQFGRHTALFSSDAEGHRRAMRYMVFAGHEFLFGPTSITLQAGLYLKADEVFKPFFLYNRLILKYYPFYRKNGLQPFIGIGLKSHRAVGDYVALKIGMGHAF